jgi:hypothetical protein
MAKAILGLNAPTNNTAKIAFLYISTSIMITPVVLLAYDSK